MTKSDAVKAFGSVANLAEALGITREAIYQWPEQIPRGRAFEIKHILSQRELSGVQPSDAA